MTTVIATRGVTAVSTNSFDQQSAHILTSDMKPAHVIVMQPGSTGVKNKKAQAGDIVKSQTFTKLGDETTPVEVVFLHVPLTFWMLYQEGTKGRWEYRKTIERFQKNDNLPWEFYGDKDGNDIGPGVKGVSKWKRVKNLKVAALLLKEITTTPQLLNGELPDLDQVAAPVQFPFKVSSYNTGKTVVDHFAKAISQKVDGWKYSLPLTTKLETNKNGDTYYSFNIGKSKAVKKEFWGPIAETAKAITSNLFTDEDEEMPSTTTDTSEEPADIIC